MDWKYLYIFNHTIIKGCACKQLSLTSVDILCIE